MIPHNTPMRGVALVEGKAHLDERGSTWKFLDRDPGGGPGSSAQAEQGLVVTNTRAHTLRGMHYQVEPYDESKLLWVTRGAVWDVLVDLRPDEATFGHWFAVELAAERRMALRVPPMVAHGYLTLTDDTELTYLIAGTYSPEHARTLRWDDPTVGIEWPFRPELISTRDREGHLWPPP